MVRKRVHPEIVVAMAAAVWGLFWIPLRALDERGLDPGWVIVCQFSVPLLLLLPFGVWRWWHGRPVGLAQWVTGLLAGGGVALYSESLLLTSVARALILFYVMPAWGTLIEVGLMGRRFTVWRGGALVLSVAGLLAILGLNRSAPSLFNLGDFLALLSGILFTFGAMRVREAEAVSVFEQVFAFFFSGLLVALGMILLPLEVLGRPPTVSLVLSLLPLLLGMSGLVLIPAMWGIYWGSRFVDPGRLGIILQLEAVVGIGSAAVLAGEPFGWGEAAGAVLVVGAGVVEVLGNRGSDKVAKAQTR